MWGLFLVAVLCLRPTALAFNCYAFATGDRSLTRPGLRSRGHLLRRPLTAVELLDAVRADLEPRGWEVPCQTNYSIQLRGFLGYNRPDGQEWGRWLQPRWTQFHFIRSDDGGHNWKHKRGFRGPIENTAIILDGHGNRAPIAYGPFIFPELAVQACRGL